MTSLDLLAKSLESWSAFAGRKLSEEGQEAWVREFVNIDPVVLKEGLELVTSRAKRMPWPGDLTEALGTVRERRHFSNIEPLPNFPTVDSKDPETGRKVKAQIDGAGELYFRAEDCPEGREFLRQMRAMALVNDYEFFTGKGICGRCHRNALCPGSLASCAECLLKMRKWARAKRGHKKHRPGGPGRWPVEVIMQQRGR